MEIKDILDQLGLDLSNPDTKRGAMEAIEAILASRASANGSGSSMGMAGMGMNEIEVELDPDLLQPSIKQAPSGDIDDVEIEDEEDILSQIKRNESEDPIENPNSEGKDSDSDSDSNSSSEDSEADSSDNTGSGKDDVTEKDPSDNTDSSDSAEKSFEETDDTNVSETEDSDTDTSETEESDSDGTDDVEEDDEDTNEIPSDEGDEGDFEDDEDASEEGIVDSEEAESDDTDAEESENDEEFDFDEEDLLDDELKNSAEDETAKSKHEARKIKRERTLAAAKTALANAQAKKVSASLIHELEKAIEALEALTEAVTKSLKDISDEEFNRLVNRVFDAIDAVGDSSLTFSSDEERQAKVKEIKDDMDSAKTQAELSAEDAAKIRAETQVVKAREKEAAKYAPRGRHPFKGFQDFLNSLYRAIALQVHHEETHDDSWSALSRRNSGAGVLQQGKKLNELPNKKIPVIDFYFDQSGSWTESDIKIGEKAVQCLAEMAEAGQIKINVYYFSNNVFSDAASARAQGGTSAWNDIVKNVIATQATNVVIMTDWDMEYHWRPSSQPPLKYTVPGYVWYLWKDGENAPRLPRDLRGRGGVQQFAFSAGDL